MQKTSPVSDFMTFHEKAGNSQDDHWFYLKGVLPFSQAASDAILASALLVVSDDRSVQVGRTRFSRCCYLIIDLGSRLFDGSWART